MFSFDFWSREGNVILKLSLAYGSNKNHLFATASSIFFKAVYSLGAESVEKGNDERGDLKTKRPVPEDSARRRCEDC